MQDFYCFREVFPSNTHLFKTQFLGFGAKCPYTFINISRNFGLIFYSEIKSIWVSVVCDRIHRSSDDFSNESIQQHSYPGLPAILPYLSDSALIYEVERGEFFLDDENWTSLPKLCEEAIRSWWQGQSWREGPLPNDHGISSAIFLHSACAWKVERGVSFRSNLEIFWCTVSCKITTYYFVQIFHFTTVGLDTRTQSTQFKACYLGGSTGPGI